MPDIVDDSRQRVRICFSKSGPARYLSHNDLVRTWERALRRAGLPLAYTGGFSPGPELRFGPPLPVGYDGCSELLDADFEKSVFPYALMAGLSKALPSGLAVISASIMPVCKANLMSAARAANYKTILKNPPANLPVLISEFLSKNSLSIEVTRGKKVREIDVRGAVLRLEAIGEDALGMQLKLGHGAACRPNDVARVLDLEVERNQRLSVIYEFPSPSI